jgi:hypothetical protein
VKGEAYGFGGALEVTEVYDYDTGTFRVFDSKGSLIEERRPGIPRNAAIAYVKAWREKTLNWPRLKFVPVDSGKGPK